MSSMPNRAECASRRGWLVAWVLALALHSGAILGLQSLPTLQTAPATFHQPAPIQLMFAKPASETRARQEPSYFSELPADRADAAPEKPEFLSNVMSRARDRVPGGGAELPRLEGENDAPLVRLAADEGPSPPQTASVPAPQSIPLEGTRQEESQPPNGAEQGPGGHAEASSNSHERGGDRVMRATADEEFRGVSGNSDIHQLEMANPDGNASLLGDVSLNTTAWDYAPWLQRFGRQLRERWYPPTAYSLGILKEGGWTLIEVEISRSGKLLRLDTLDEQGHPSLIRAAQGALRSMAPIESLPTDFPQPTLILRIHMIYPKIRPR